MEEDQEGVEEAEGVEEQRSHWPVAVGAEEGQLGQLRNALAVVEDTSCWEEAGARLHRV